MSVLLKKSYQKEIRIEKRKLASEFHDALVPFAERRNIDMKIWLDDIRPAPEGYIWCKSVNSAKRMIESARENISVLDLDHDLGDYAYDGGDGIKLLDWFVETQRFYPIRIHTMNPVGRENMVRLVKRYW